MVISNLNTGSSNLPLKVWKLEIWGEHNYPNICHLKIRLLCVHKKLTIFNEQINQSWKAQYENQWLNSVS